MLSAVRRRGGLRNPVAWALAAAMGVLAACSSPPALPVTADPPTWAARVRRAIDDATLADGSVEVPDGANVFAARIFAGESPAYALFEAGGGAFSEAFYPASAVKLLAALGALDFLGGLGLSGDAVVDDGYTVREIYDAALRWSSNEDYDSLVRIAGVDRLNRRFLAGNGYGATSIQEPYGGGEEQVAYSPEMVLAEGGRQVVVPEREGDGDYGCDGGNCTDLFALSDAVRRVVLDGELPVGERFGLAPADIAALQDALLGAEGFIAPGVEAALGSGARIYTKPGWVPGLDCVEAALVVDPTSGHRFLVAVSAPDVDGCDVLARMARDILTVLDKCDDAVAVRADGSLVDVVGGVQSRQVVDVASPVGCRR
jgi:hypothetical protein